VNSTATVSYTYDAWGEVLSATGTLAEINPLRYRGYYYDAETKLYYLKSRYYDPQVCRFLNADDVGLLGVNGDFISYNLFVYCGNNPVINQDHEGHWLNIAIGAVVGGVIAGAAVYAQTGNTDKAFVACVVGAVNGAIAATGLGMVSQTLLSALSAGLGDLYTQRYIDGSHCIDVKRTAINALVAGGCSIIGSVLGKITSFAYADAGKALKARGQDRIVIAYARKLSGQSYMKMLHQGRDLHATGSKLLNTGYGIASVTGSVLTFGIGVEFSV